MKKLTLISAVMLIFCLIFSTAVSAAEGDIAVYIDNNPVTFDVPPQMINDRTMVPMRAIFEQLGATVTWDDTTKTATAATETTVVTVTINSTIITINGEAKAMDVAPQIVDSRTLVPVRFVSEAFNCTVEWDGVNRIVYISTVPAEAATEVVEEPTEITTEIVTEPAQAEYSYYTDSAEPFPTYDSVTGALYINNYYDDNAYSYTYTYTNLADVESYLGVLEDEGWVAYKSYYDSESNTQIYYYTYNNDYMIGVFVEYSFDQVWVIFMTTDYYLEDNSGSDYELYDAVSPFPTYDSVTGSDYISFYEADDADGFNVAVYEYEDSDTFLSYVYTLRDEYGWGVYDIEQDEDNYTYTVYMYKGNNLIAVMIDFKYNQVWILYQ